MLQSIRDRAQGVLAWVIVGLIIIPFALWGIEEYIGGGSEIHVAKVDDAKITQRAFQQAYENYRQQVRSALGADAQVDDAKLKQDVLKGMVDNELVKQAVDDLGLRVSNGRLAEEIQAMQPFQENGAFSKTAFTEQLSRQGLTPDGFAELVRAGLLADQVNTSITSLTVVSQSELDRNIRLANQQREFGYLILPWEKFKGEVKVDATAIKKYYDEKRDTLVNPEQLSIEYLELSAASLAESIKPTDEEIQKLYDEQRASFQQEGKRRASEIVFPLDTSAEVPAIAATLAVADRVLKQLRAGTDFAKLAKELAKPPATATDGDLGLVGRGSLTPELEQALFALAKPGDLSKPIKDAKGFHILKLTEIQPPQTKAIAEVRPQLVKEVQLRKAEQLYFDKIEPLTNLVYENPDTLSVASKELGLPVKTSKLFDRSGAGGAEGISTQAKVLASAFSNEVLGQGYNSEPLEIGENHLLVLRVKEHKASSVRSLAEVQPLISERLTQQAAEQKAVATGVAIEKRLAKGEDPAAVAKQFGVEWNKPVLVGREETTLITQPAITGAAFKLAKPSATPKAPPVSGGLALESGDYAVIGLYAVRDGDSAKLNASEKLALRRQIQRSKSQYEYQAFVDELRAEAEIEVYQDKL